MSQSLQALREPLLQLVRHFGLHALARGPFAQHRLEIAELEEEVLGLAPHRRGAREHRHRVLQVERRVGRAARFAGVAVLVGGAAARAAALDVAVRQEQALLGVEGLLDRAPRDVAARREAGVDQLREVAVLGGMRGVEIVGAHQEAGGIGAVTGLDALDQLLGCQPFLLGAQHHRRAVRVARRTRRCRRGRAGAGSAPRCRSGSARSCGRGAAARWHRAVRW